MMTENMEQKKSFERACVTLEFDKVKEMLAAVCPTEGAKKLAAALYPSRTLHTVRRMLAETDAAKAMQTVKGMPLFYGIADITNAVDRADKGAVLTPKEILDVGRTLTAARAVQAKGTLRANARSAPARPPCGRRAPQRA